MVVLGRKLHQPMNPKRKEKIAQPRFDFEMLAQMLDQRIATALQKFGERFIGARYARIQGFDAAVAHHDLSAAKIHRDRSLIVSCGKSEAATHPRCALAPLR